MRNNKITHVPHMATQKWISDNWQKSNVHFTGRLIGISAQSDRLLDPEIDRYNTSVNVLISLADVLTC